MAKGMAASMVKRHKKKTTVDLGSKGEIPIKPGALHRQLGIPEGESIPDSKLAEAAKAGGKLGQRARLAETLKGFKK